MNQIMIRGVGMQYIYGTADIMRQEDCVVVLGNFDGVHKGHQRLFQVAKDRAKANGLRTVVFSFYPHPTWVIGDNRKALIMSRRDKKQVIGEMGIDELIEYPFTRTFAAISPETFFVDILMKRLKAKILVVGSNYYFGKGKTGNPKYLRQLGEKYNIEVCIVDAVKIGGSMISSSSIRKLILEGNIEKANEMLGIVGNVVQGKQLGRTIGFPTINLIADPDRVYPPNGVYATVVRVYSKTYRGMTNIGVNPTVSGQRKMIETHIFNYDADIYGEAVEVYFYHYVRPEQKFKDINALKAQIQQDKWHVQEFFANPINLFANDK